MVFSQEKKNIKKALRGFLGGQRCFASPPTGFDKNYVNPAPTGRTELELINLIGPPKRDR